MLLDCILVMVIIKKTILCNRPLYVLVSILLLLMEFKRCESHQITHNKKFIAQTYFILNLHVVAYEKT